VFDFFSLFFICVFAILSTFYVRKSKVNTCINAATLLILVLLLKDVGLFVMNNQVFTVLLVFGYFVVGFIYSFIAWFVALKKEYRYYINKRDEFGIVHKVDFSNSSVDSVGVPMSVRNDFCDIFRRFNLGFSYNKYDDCLILPSASGNVGLISFYCVLWVFCLVDLVVGDGIEFLILLCSRYYDSIVRAVVK